MEEKEYVKPKLKTPPPPELLIIDLDSIVYKAALVAEKTEYIATLDGEELGVFRKAADYKKWKEECDIFCDTQFGLKEEEVQKVERVTRKVYGDPKEACKAFDSIVKDWVKLSGCKDWVGYIGNDDSKSNYRFQFATRFPYKGTRQTEKPKYLKDVREHAKRNPNVIVSDAELESDDHTVMRSQKYKHRGCVSSCDKDLLNTQGCWLFNPDTMGKSVFSSRKVVGTLYEEKGKVTGTGILHLLFQSLVGDQIDNIRGIDGIGPKKSLAALGEFSGVDKKHTKEAINVVAKMYKEAFGDAYRYTHIHTGEEVAVGWQDVLRENLILLHMLRWKGDDVEWIMEEIENDEG